MKRVLVFMTIMLVACQPTTSTATPISPTLTTKDVPPETQVPTIPPSTVELDGAEVPQGFSLIKFADLYRPTGFTFDEQGRLYVTSQDGNVYILEDEDRNGRAESRSTFATGYYFPLGVAIHSPTGHVYVSYQGAITVLRDTNGDDRADSELLLVDDLPFDKHQNDNLEFGPDGWLYIGVGSTCDACEDRDPRSASICVLTSRPVRVKSLRPACATRITLPLIRRRVSSLPPTTAATTWGWSPPSRN